MPDYYSSGRDPRRNSNERYARPQNSRPGQGARPAGNRPSQGRRPAKRRKKRTQPRFYAIIAAIVLVLVIALALVITLGKDNKGPVVPQATPVPANINSGMSNATVSSRQPDEAVDAENAETAVMVSAADVATQADLASLLGDEEADITGHITADMVTVSDLSLNNSLPKDWMNVLLLGTDERTLTESPRTDTMIICSINPTSGEVKLTSIMRDTAVQFDDLETYNGTYRINAANYFGGPEYAMKTINELLDMNIQHYVMVNFFGFQRIAEALGGIEVDITEAEMNEINKKQYQQFKIAQAIGEEFPHVDKGDLLQVYGPNTHLNGHQVLAYARVRNVDSDFSRAERQRNVLVKLMEKLKGKNAVEIISLANTFSGDIKTNMDLNNIIEIAITVLNSGLSNVETFRVPMNKTYTEERRNDQAMLYDCDWATNSRELYSFIYN